MRFVVSQNMYRFVAVFMLASGLMAGPARAVQLRNVCEVQGARPNMLKGMGIVVGLDGTGDKADAAINAQDRMLQRMGIEVSDVDELVSANSAIVVVTATLPPFAKAGTHIDVKVDSIYDCESLEGGTLLETHLKGPGMGETVYALAQGAVTIGGFQAQGGGGTSVQQGHVTSGRIPMGATVEHEVPSTITDGRRLTLLVKQPTFSTANSVREVIEETLGDGSAIALGAGTVRVTIPEEAQTDLVGFIARLEELEIETETAAKVVINERTGTIVVGGNVVIKPCQVAHGNLTIRIATTPVVTPALPFTDAEPIVTESVDLDVEEQEARLMPVSGTSAADVAEALNRLRVTPTDMISIFQALRTAGALEADLQVM